MKQGVFSYRSKQIRFCPICERAGSYLKYKSGRNKGLSNFNKPTYLNGYKFNEGFITIQGYGDICRDCENKHSVIKTVASYILEQNLPVELKNNKETNYRKDPIQICFQCNKEMQTSKMGKLDAIMGGTYPGRCPNCGAKEMLFGASHKSTDKYVMVRVKERK